MLRVTVTTLLLFINFVLQSTLFQYIAVIGVKPNTALIIIVCYSVLRGDAEGAVVGFFSGLLQDIFMGDYIGMYALLGMLTGFICGKPLKDFYRENYLLPLLVTAVSAIAYGFAFYFMSFLFRGKLDLLYYFRRIILPETVYTIVMTLPIYSFVYWLNNRVEHHERYTRKLFRE
jgi:rod shape-determining protein MreD